MDLKDFPQKLYDQSLRFLSFRPRSEAELFEYWKRKKVNEKEIPVVLKLLKELNLINDYEFAKWWVEQRNQFRPKGKQLLALELRKKGISKDIIDAVFEESINKESEWEKAYTIASKKARTMKNIEKHEFVAKLRAFLGRRGFNFELIRSVVDALVKKE